MRRNPRSRRLADGFHQTFRLFELRQQSVDGRDAASGGSFLLLQRASAREQLAQLGYGDHRHEADKEEEEKKE